MAEPHAGTNAAVYRHQALHAGFSPLPLIGKQPVLKNWQKHDGVSDLEIDLWSKYYPLATNTGILTRLAPALDIDILDPDAAAAVEAMAKERFEEVGFVPVRFGRSPKRALLFRTDTTFSKITASLIAPDGSSGQRIEFLCDGQQLVADGIHPDTGRPYEWHDGVPGDLKREDLAYIHEPQAQTLHSDLVELLVGKFGYGLVKARAKKSANGADDPIDWAIDFADHDQVAATAMKLLKAGMHDGAAVNFLRAQVDKLTEGHPDRKARRLKEIPGMVESARAKLDDRATTQPPPPAPATLAQVIQTFEKWLKLKDSSANAVYAVLGTIAANHLDGEPVWTGLVAPPSSAKTEILNAMSRLPDVEAVGTLSMSGLLSGTPKRQTRSSAHGGLLRKLGDFGILALKDFGSLLSLRHEARVELMGALREIYDGAWTRHIGSDGGRTLSWKGKVGLVFCATQAFDDERAFIAALGDRFLVCRLAPPLEGQLKKAMEHRGPALKAMRNELADVVAGLFLAVKGRQPRPITNEEVTRLETVVSLAIRLRGHVQRDRYSREIDSVHQPEGPSRLGLTLERLLAGLDVIGLDRDDAIALVETIALDNCPPARRRAFACLGDTPITTRAVAIAIGLPTITTRRILEDISAQGLAVRSRQASEQGEEKQGGADLWTRAEDYLGIFTKTTVADWREPFPQVTQ